MSSINGRPKGSPNKKDRGNTSGEVLSREIKVRVSSTWLQLVKDYRSLHSGQREGRSSEGALIRVYVLQSMLRNGRIDTAMINRIVEELVKTDD